MCTIPGRKNGFYLFFSSPEMFLLHSWDLLLDCNAVSVRFTIGQIEVYCLMIMSHVLL